MSVISKEFLDRQLKKAKIAVPKGTTGYELMEAALKISNCPDLSQLTKSVYSALTGKPRINARLPKKESGFVQPINGVLPKIDLHLLSHGVWCQVDGHLGSASNLQSNDTCNPCNKSGPVMKDGESPWNMPPFRCIRSSADCFLIVLATRSSGGKAIPSRLFDDLRNTVLNNIGIIREFLREKTGKEFEIHIIQEAAANGSILSLQSDMFNHDRSAAGTNDLHLPLARTSELFKYHYVPNWKVGYMLNHPGDFNSKLANYVANLIDLKKAGIPPADVIYMTHGQVITGASRQQTGGVQSNFGIFDGQMLLDDVNIVRSPGSNGLVDCSHPAVADFLLSAGGHAVVRTVRTGPRRKSQAAPKV